MLRTLLSLAVAFTATFATAKNPVVVISTSMGDIKVELFEDKAPKTVRNFLQYVNEKFYDGTVFHRVINDFMIQGGGFDEKIVQKKTRAPVQNEASNGLKNELGTLAMARTSDPNSATAQLFINVKANDFLNRSGDTPAKAGYCVFGKVVGGINVVEKIKTVPTGNKGGMPNVPTTNVVMKSVRVSR